VPASPRLLLDSVILIDHFNGVEPATLFLAGHRHETAVSVITRAEVLVGHAAEDERFTGGTAGPGEG